MICKAFAIFSKTRLSKMVQLGGYLKFSTHFFTGNFGISRNTDIDCVLIDNFYLF